MDEIPRQQRLLFCHAYLSYLWSKVVWRRIRTYGIKVLAGDLVNKKKGDMVEENDEQRFKEEYFEHVEDPDSYTIHDIIIPILGFKVMLCSSVVILSNL